jgi:hypothetical protein
MKMILTVGGMTQVVEHLPSKHKALSSNFSTNKTQFYLQLFKTKSNQENLHLMNE